MEASTSAKERWAVYLSGVLFAFVVMRFGFGPASVSMHWRPEYDLNIYHLIGWEWMQGLLPYTNFSDLKGPLVFLLHGVGAMLSPGSFLGACVLESLLVGAGVLYAYRAARLLLPPGAALGVMGAYSAALMYFSLHPAEIVWVLQQMALYYLLRWAVQGAGLRRIHQLALGASLGVVLLVKFNLAVFWLPFILWSLGISRSSWWRALGWQFLGAGLILGPALLYFHAHGALGMLWQEYVLNAVRYGSCPWADSALASRGWRLAAEMLPLHLHQALPEVVAALLGLLMLIPCLFLPVVLPGRRGLLSLGILLFSCVLLMLANYGGSRCYIHYAFSFSVYFLVGLVVLAHAQRRMAAWVGAAVLLAVLGGAVGLPVAVKYWKPHNGNAEMHAVSQRLAKCLGHGELVVLDAENALHLQRLSGARLKLRHFVPAMVPGGYAQHRAELAAAIGKEAPRFLVGSVRSARADAELLGRCSACYRACRHSELGLPAFPQQAKRPEFILYIRQN